MPDRPLEEWEAEKVADSIATTLRLISEIAVLDIANAYMGEDDQAEIKGVLDAVKTKAAEKANKVWRDEIEAGSLIFDKELQAVILDALAAATEWVISTMLDATEALPDADPEALEAYREEKRQSYINMPNRNAPNWERW